MEVYRLIRAKFANDLSGKGAALYGARWNSVGTELIYTAANRSLAMAEVAVHLTLANLPPDYLMFTIKIPDNIPIAITDQSTLPANWNQFPHSLATQHVGDSFVAKKQDALLQVPSAVTKGDYNYLINPAHPDFKLISVMSKESFPFDRRIFKL